MFNCFGHFPCCAKSVSRLCDCASGVLAEVLSGCNCNCHCGCASGHNHSCGCHRHSDHHDYYDRGSSCGCSDQNSCG